MVLGNEEKIREQKLLTSDASQPLPSVFRFKGASFFLIVGFLPELGNGGATVLR
jgi:hypothetical protein